MEKSKKWMILGMCATIFCLAVAITCAALRKFDLVSSIMLGFIVVFSVVISVFMWRDLLAKSGEVEEEQKDEESAVVEAETEDAVSAEDPAESEEVPAEESVEEKETTEEKKEEIEE